MLIKLFKNKVIMNFFFVDLFSSIAVGSISTGASWYVLSETNLNSMLSIYVSLNVIATFLLSSFIGKIVDKKSRRSMIIFSLFSRAGIFIIISILLSIVHFNFLIMCIISAIFGIGWLLYYSASRSYLQNVIPKESLGELNSVLEISLQVGMFMSAGITGILIEFVDFYFVLAYGSFFLLLSGFIAIRLPNENDLKIETSIFKEQANDDSIGIFSLLKENRNVLLISLLSMIPLFIIQVYNISMPGYILHTLKTSSSIYGLADMLYGIGGMIAGIISGYLMSKIKTKKLLLFVFSGLTFFFFILYLQKSISLLLVLSFSIGLFNSAARIFLNTVLMKNVRNTIMGRVTTFITATTQISSLILTLGVGIFNDKYGANTSFLFIVLILVVASSVTLKNRNFIISD